MYSPIMTPLHTHHACPSRLASLLLFSTTCALALAGPVFVDKNHHGTDHPLASWSIRERSVIQDMPRRLKNLRVPGFSVAVVKDDEVIYANGLGVKNKSESVTTLFPIVSMTKSFTAARTYLEMRKIDHWLRSLSVKVNSSGRCLSDDIIVNSSCKIPWRARTRCHGDSAMGQVNLTRHKFIRRMRHLDPSKDFCSTWQYNNLMFMVSGEVSTRVSCAASWEDLVTERLLTPLGMKRSSANARGCRPHSCVLLDRLVTQRIPVDTLVIDSVAGSIYSSALEMTRWLPMYLNRGEHENKTVVSAEALEQVLTPHMVVPVKPKFREVGYMSYGLGWDIFTWKGRRLIQHGGNLSGTTLSMVVFPDDGLAVVVLSNCFVTALPKAVTYMAADYFLDNVVEKSGWRGRFEHDDEEFSKKILEVIAKKDADRVNAVAPVVHPAYGETVISGAESGLTVNWHGYEAKLDHYHYDQFLFPGLSILPVVVSFFTDVTEKVDRLGQEARLCIYVVKQNFIGDDEYLK
ncbi:LOW QUALITY PROTEIN: beta-lactamase/transpeptidase-like protein [Endogone sp. FLAS-F59071]|nr:LOW QUALITY PROTEIN: beta-lactamase/transpeptidase-like protein [Endogone sp. FLAS-F59071]|eukprot:RUS20626.1 LOW QUALITY PROTEIN: beta-lactamase/transpeptidase-like protein [Endogone sp. FLAS-F59071]